MMIYAYWLAFAALRIGGMNNVFFKDAAHIYVGGLIGATIALWYLPTLVRKRCETTLEVRQGFTPEQAKSVVDMVEEHLHYHAKLFMNLAIILSLIELSVAIIQRI